MAAPERLHIVLNAADGIAQFEKMGLRHTYSEPPAPEQITEMLGRQIGGMFQLQGFTDEPRVEVALQIREVSKEQTLWMRNRLEPPFEGRYSVAADPPPMISIHGDYLFDLVHSQSSED